MDLSKPVVYSGHPLQYKSSYVAFGKFSFERAFVFFYLIFSARGCGIREFSLDPLMMRLSGRLNVSAIKGGLGW